MKNNALIALLAVPFFFACNKPKTAQPTAAGNTNTETVMSRPTPAQGGPKINAKFVGSTRGCDPTNPDNCVILWEPVVVRPKLVILMDGAVTGGPSAVASAFSSSDVLTTDIPDQIGSIMLKNLQSGSYYLAKADESATAVSYYAGPSLPLNVETQELVFEIQK